MHAVLCVEGWGADRFCGVLVLNDQSTICGVSVHTVESVALLPLFNIQIRGLADRFLMEMLRSVNLRTEKAQFSKIPFEDRKNM
jgi:hypothetical protein